MSHQRFSNVAEVPLALAVFLASDFYDHDSTPKTISATTLLKPLRQIILSARIPPSEALVDLADMMNNRMGAAIHDGIEKAWKTNHRQAMKAMGYPDRIIERVKINPEPHEVTEDCIPVYLEQRLKRKLGDWTVTGKFDFVAEGRVQDFKSTSVWVYKNQVNSKKYPQQGSIYRWLDPKLITDPHMDIHYIFTDWKAAMLRSDPDYPKRRFLKQSFPLISLQEIEAWMRRKIQQIEQYWDAPEPEIPFCEDEDLWRSEPVWKYYKNPTKTARSTKNFSTRQEAMQRYIEDGSVGMVKEVPGQVTACKYCPAFILCSQKDKLIACGDLSLE